jgi:hypothetical protein
VHAVGGAGDRELGLVVDDEERVVGVAKTAKDAPRLDYIAIVRGFLAQLDDVDAGLKCRPQDLFRLLTAGTRLADQIEVRALEPCPAPLSEAVRLRCAGLGINWQSSSPPLLSLGTKTCLCPNTCTGRPAGSEHAERLQRGSIGGGRPLLGQVSRATGSSPNSGTPVVGVDGWA